MLTQQQVSWKNEVNAKAWCRLKGFKFLQVGAFDVFFQEPEQAGLIVKKALGMELSKRNWYEAYSKINWLDVFAELEAAEHQMHLTGGTSRQNGASKRKAATVKRAGSPTSK